MADEYRSPDDQVREAMDALEPYATAVGKLCNTWADLETIVAELFLLLMEAKEDAGTFAMVDCLDFRDQLTAIRVGVTAKKEPDWATLTIESVDYIDNVLRLRRNRYVHDRWEYIQGTGVARVDPTPKVYKEPGSGKRAWRRLGVSPEPVDNVNDTADAVFDEMCFMGDLYSTFAGDRVTTPQALREARPPRLLTLPAQGMPRQRDSYD